MDLYVEKANTFAVQLKKNYMANLSHSKFSLFLNMPELDQALLPQAPLQNGRMLLQSSLQMLPIL